MAVVDMLVKPFISLFIVANLLFIVWRLMPGDPISVFSSGSMEASLPMGAEYVRALWGLDLPISVQYPLFLFNLFSLRVFQTLSFSGGYRPVGEMVAARLPNTLVLVLVPFLLVASMFTLYYWALRNHPIPAHGWRRRVYSILFTKSFWLIAASAFFWVAWQLAIQGVLPGYGTHSSPEPADPVAYALDFGWHLVAPAAITALASVAVGVHYFYQEPDRPMPPLSHGLPRLLLWTTSIAVPIEGWYSWYGIGRMLLESTFMMNYPALLGILVAYLCVFGSSAVLLEAVLRWALYRNPVELHGQDVVLPQRATLRQGAVIVGLVLVGIFGALGIAGQFVLPLGPLPRASPLEYTLRSIYPLLVEGLTIGIGVAVLGGVLGLVAYFALRSKLPWPASYIPCFVMSLLVLTLFIQPIIPFVFGTPMSAFSTSAYWLLSVGAIRRISNTELGSGRTALRSWLSALLPLVALYTFVGGCLAFVGGFIGFFYTQNLGWVLQDLFLSGLPHLNPAIILLPSLCLFLFILAFDILWSGLRHLPK
jgi:ABC-type dipeptide/oligopeptide/nickel transport system permease component